MRVARIGMVEDSGESVRRSGKLPHFRFTEPSTTQNQQESLFHLHKSSREIPISLTHLLISLEEIPISGDEIGKSKPHLPISPDETPTEKPTLATRSHPMLRLKWN